MKKLLLIILLLNIAISTKCYSQEMPTVAGVELGSSYEQCKKVLDNRFNAGKDSYQLDSNTLYYTNINFANEPFDYVNFNFQSDGKRSYLYEIEFFQKFDLSNEEMAKYERDKLAKVYEEKYELRWTNKNKNGFEYYVLGHNPNNKDDGVIVIGTDKGKTGAGVMKLWTSVIYGPVNFINASDEI
jgi:hypothetical protein